MAHTGHDDLSLNEIDLPDQESISQLNIQILLHRLLVLEIVLQLFNFTYCRNQPYNLKRFGVLVYT